MRVLVFFIHVKSTLSRTYLADYRLTNSKAYIAFCLTEVHAQLWCSNTIYVACASGDLRIEQCNATAEKIEGFVQYCWNGTWSTLDPGRWESNETSVACRQLGYQGNDYHE